MKTTVFWVEWKDPFGRWVPERGWGTAEAAEYAAHFYRRDRNAATRVMPYVNGKPAKEN